MGRSDVIRTLKPEAFADDKFGAITVKDILAELEKPGRDPRPDFKVARFNDGVEDIKDLQPGMTLEGTVSNVAQFGAFVDLGVHQDGLVHVSQLAQQVRQRCARGGEDRRHRQGQGAGGGPGAQAHLADDEARRQAGDQGRARRQQLPAGRRAASGRARRAVGAAAPAGASAMAAAFAKLQGGR